jgi:hypothetical protein
LIMESSDASYEVSSRRVSPAYAAIAKAIASDFAFSEI